MALDIYKVTAGKSAGQWRWRTQSSSDITASGNESYHNRKDLEAGVVSALRDILDSEVDGVREAVVDYIEALAAEGVLLLPGGNVTKIGDKQSSEIAKTVASFAQSWRPVRTN